MIEDILHARTAGYQKRLEQAREFVSRALKVSEYPAVCVSGGKDSTVLLSLVLEQTKNVLPVFYDSGMEFPETYETLKKLEKFFDIEILIVETAYSMQEIIELEKELGGLSKNFVKNTLVYDPSIYVKENYNIDLFFVGLRAEESKNRRLTIIKKIPYYYNQKLGYYLAYPIGYLTVYDVFTYIYTNNLPIHPFYENQDILQPREERRVGVIGGTAAITSGRYYWLKLNYPELFEKLIKLDPTVLWFV